jgi:hypothetical protein
MDERPAVRGMWIFSIIWLGQLVSILGSSITGFALSIWVHQRTGSAAQFSLIAFCGVLGVLSRFMFMPSSACSNSHFGFEKLE